MLRQEDIVVAEGPQQQQQQWPRSSPAAAFLAELLAQAGAGPPQLGAILRVRLPPTELPLDFSPPRHALTRSGGTLSPLLHTDSSSVELEVRWATYSQVF